MAELLKNRYNDDFFERLVSAILELDSDFDTVSFLKQLYGDGWEDLELKERMRRITVTLHAQLQGSYKSQIKFIVRLIPQLLNVGFKSDNFECMFLPDYVEVYGMDDYKTSVSALERITQFVSCEFAVRPFLMRYSEQMIAQMMQWSTHRHAAVRRLATEGIRPRLPWAMGLPFLKADPSPIWPILDQLKNDPSETVRRSVANNLNDISKDHPELVVEVVSSWQGKSQETDRLLKHGARTLLKQGHPKAMRLFGFGPVKKLEIASFVVLTPKVKIGEALSFSYELINNGKKKALIRLEYGLYYMKANGQLSKKVFTISEKIYPAQSNTTIRRNQSFKIISTRKFYIGRHKISIILNGVEMDIRNFDLID